MLVKTPQNLVKIPLNLFNFFLNLIKKSSKRSQIKIVKLSIFIKVPNMTSKGSNHAKINNFVRNILLKKWTLQFYMPHFTVLVLNQTVISSVFAIVRFPFAPKSVLSPPVSDLIQVLCCSYNKTENLSVDTAVQF